MYKSILRSNLFIASWKSAATGPPARLRPVGDYAPEGRSYGSESVVRVLRQCLKIKHGSIGMKTGDYDVFLFCF